MYTLKKCIESTFFVNRYYYFTQGLVICISVISSPVLRKIIHKFLFIIYTCFNYVSF